MTPILYTADGREVRLETLELAPNSVQELPLAEALAAAGEWARSGAVALEFQAPNAAAVAGYALVMDERRSLLFNSVFRVGYAGGGSKTFFAPWWLRDEETRGTLVLFNASEEQLTVHPSVAVGLIEYTLDEITLTPHQVKEIDLRTLLRENGLPGADRGLLRLGYDGPKQALFPALLLFNEKTGHSLAVNFAAAQEPNEDPANTIYFPAVLVNHPDPVLGFKSSLKLTPHALLGNTTSEFLSVELKATFELPGASEVKSVTLPVAPLAPLEMRLVDFSTYIAEGIIPEEISQVSLRLSYQGAGSDLAAHVFTMDRSGDFTFSMAGLISVAPRYDAISWYVAGNGQSPLHVQNISEEEVQAQVTLSYYEGQGSYQLPLLTVPPQATRTVNLKELIATAQPDPDGNLIPPGTSFGTATVEVADGRLAPRLLASGAQYYPALAMGGGTFFPCIGVEQTELLANPTAGLVGGFDFLTVKAHWSDGGSSIVTQDSSLSGGDPLIATVQNGGADHGKVAFLGAGQTGALSDTLVCAFNPEDPIICIAVVLLAFALIDSDLPPSVSLSCPSSVARGGSAMCTASINNAPAGAAISFTEWKFTDSNNNTVNRTTNTTAASWSGTMVTGGTVSVKGVVNAATLIIPGTASITVNPRNWHTNPVSATNVPNGTFRTLPVPVVAPPPGTVDGGLGASDVRTGDTGFNSTIIQDSGPNQGYAYFASQLTFSHKDFRYTINPDLENQNSAFSQHQCGHSGIISWNDLLTQTNRHEFNHPTQSHHGLYTASMNSSANNPGDFFEARMAPPGADLQDFVNLTRGGLDNRYNLIGAQAGNDMLIFAINESATGTFLGDIQFPPFTIECNP